ncbi:MAG TPA: trypsin-like peptidase domain-containing protein [Herpetosiphonaceae bacterium]
MTPLTFWKQHTASGAQQVRRIGVTSLLALALVGGAGSAVGSAVTAVALNPQPAQAAVSSTQTIAQSTLNTNVAGTVLTAVGPSVVEITTVAQVGFRNATATGTGSGFVLDTNGLIATNNHVVDGATNITVTFSTGEQESATIVGTDSANDLALIRVTSLPASAVPVTLGDSSAVTAGETAIAIGSPFGLEQTITEGIISAVSRTWTTSGETFRGLIQTDTAINPGNSGGPLLNAAGEVIGINTMIESPVEGNVGMGFAVPINTLKQQLAQLESGATVEQGYLGVSIAEATDVSQSGVAVGEVSAGSGAAQAGLQAGDIITAIDGSAVTDYESLAGYITGGQAGETVTVTYERNGQQQQASVTLQARSTS